MFAAYPGDIVFSKIDARNGAIGVLQETIAKAVVTSEFPIFVPAPERLDGEFVKLVLRTGSFLAALHAKASGTSGRKRITPEGTLRRTVEGCTAQTSPYPTVQLRDVIADLVVGWSPRCLNRPAHGNEWGY